ncbi:Predicted pyrophosphatase or phosphodiesterase, AlkP superfamily [Maribacter sedimenticola]|uniref:Predicted pyrophosphatase or phosphodiesterase, AlkP superfamily n=2 Tax=Maribacter sedimenticola TaxID=228956 RepID=A0ABY1SFV6_9FLAO|nr:Predicted pyrophosphatase or phosphodiesterase, AlkP superfamily [Maribacter sedimenticola]
MQDGKAEKPKLVVGIIVDQMRAEYLTRFQDKFGDKGFKRIMNDGYVFKNAHYNYIPTKTAPGHASVYTGTTPKFHGIISNSWYHKDIKKDENCVFDGNVRTIGSTSDNGERSPHKMLATTITDELQLSSQGRSKVIGISLKDRGAILPAGHMADAAYWYDDSNGNFISSTYYMETLPDWMQKFNKENKVNKHLKTDWNTLLPIEQYKESTKDQQVYETVFAHKKDSKFPYAYKSLSNKERYEILPETPYGNTIVAELAIEAIEHENLGQGDETDFLAVSFSSTDKIGHAFGPYSIEVQDTYLRLDQDLALILEQLDSKVGKGNYTLFLTADHAASDVSVYLEEQKIPTGTYHPEAVMAQVQNKLKSLYNLDGMIEAISGDQLFLNRELIDSKKLDFNAVLNVCKNELMKVPGVFEVMLRPDLERFEYTTDEKGMVQRGYHIQRSGDVVILFNAAWSSFREYGTGHGSGYTYDTHVPMLWYGSNIPKGSSTKRKSITDISPTLTLMLGLKFPNATTGEVIQELFKE